MTGKLTLMGENDTDHNTIIVNINKSTQDKKIEKKDNPQTKRK